MKKEREVFGILEKAGDSRLFFPVQSPFVRTLQNMAQKFFSLASEVQNIGA